MIKEKEVQAFSELYCLLNCFPETYLEKLPKQLFNLIKQKSSSDYYIEFDTTKPIEDQNISDEAKNILVVLKYNYWSDEEEKKKIQEVLQINERKYQDKIKEKYNPDTIFNNNKNNSFSNIEDANGTSNNSISIIEYKESIFTKILKWIRRKKN